MSWFSTVSVVLAAGAGAVFWSIGKLKRREKDLHVLGVSDLMPFHYWRHFVLCAMTLMLRPIFSTQIWGKLEPTLRFSQRCSSRADPSTSMLAEDVAPSRLRRAQSEISTL